MVADLIVREIDGNQLFCRDWRLIRFRLIHVVAKLSTGSTNNTFNDGQHAIYLSIDLFDNWVCWYQHNYNVARDQEHGNFLMKQWNFIPPFIGIPSDHKIIGFRLECADKLMLKNIRWRLPFINLSACWCAFNCQQTSLADFTSTRRKTKTNNEYCLFIYVFISY